MPLSSSIRDVVKKFLQEEDMPTLYQNYSWVNDFYLNGFPDMFRLERNISKAAMESSLGLTHLHDVARWGKLPNVRRITCPEPIRIDLYVKDLPASWLIQTPEKAVRILESQIHGFGPTYLSKLLHFSVPNVFGALDTRLVRVFGIRANKFRFLRLNATKTGGRWAILGLAFGIRDLD
jgi:hypothetical protein